MTEIERSFLAAKGFNTDLVQFLPLYDVIISNMYVCSKTVLSAWILCTKNCNLWRPDQPNEKSLFVELK